MEIPVYKSCLSREVLLILWTAGLLYVVLPFDDQVCPEMFRVYRLVAARLDGAPR